MRYKPNVLGFVLIFFCFSLGCLSVLLTRSGIVSSASTKPSASSNQAWPEQAAIDEVRETFLILGVDQLTNPDPILEAVWIAQARGPEREVVLLGYPLNFELRGSGTPTLTKLFSYSKEDGVSESFIREFAGNNPYGQPDVLIIMDETFFAGLVDFMGGVQVNSVLLNGEEVVAMQRMLFDNPESLLVTQSRVLDHLRWQLPELGNTLNITPLVNLCQEHCFLTVDPAELALWASPLLPMEPEAIRIETMKP